MEFSNYLVSWVATYLGGLQPTYIGVMIYSLSSMDILVFPFKKSGENFPAIWPLTEVQKNLAKTTVGCGSVSRNSFEVTSTICLLVGESGGIFGRGWLNQGESWMKEL